MITINAYCEEISLFHFRVSERNSPDVGIKSWETKISVKYSIF